MCRFWIISSCFCFCVVGFFVVFLLFGCFCLLLGFCLFLVLVGGCVGGVVSLCLVVYLIVLGLIFPFLGGSIVLCGDG